MTMMEVHFRQCIQGVLRLKFIGYLTSLRKSSYFKLGKHQFPVYDDIEDTVSPRNQFSFYIKSLM
jgi:hypothetical protein